jgi:hypothetical protein
MDPILNTALVEDRRRRCPCGPVAQHHYALCRECWAVTSWRHEILRTRYHAIPSRTRAATWKLGSSRGRRCCFM